MKCANCINTARHESLYCTPCSEKSDAIAARDESARYVISQIDEIYDPVVRDALRVVFDHMREYYGSTS